MIPLQGGISGLLKDQAAVWSCAGNVIAANEDAVW